MKHSLWLLAGGALLVALIAGCGASDYRKLPESEVDSDLRASAQELATRMLSSWREGRFEPLGEEATLAVRSGLSPEAQEQAYEQIRGMFGDFESMDYVETWVPSDGSSLFVFRFRGKFSGTEARPEIRVVMDGERKLSGFWARQWNDKLQ